MTTSNLNHVDEITIDYKPSVSHSERPKISSSVEAFRILKKNWSKDISLVEEFNLLLLDNRNSVLGISKLSRGGITQTSVDVRIAFVTALKSRACGIIMAHNHPSGNVDPSKIDIALTEKFVSAGKVLDIKVYDHIIISSEEKYYSFLDEGLISF